MAVPTEATAPLGWVGVPALRNASDIQVPEAKEPVPQVMTVAIGNLKPLDRLFILPLPKPLTPQ